MNKLLIISGPTAVGKTSAAIEIAKKYPSVLISADSRQIYKNMDIGTGKDHPPDIGIKLIDIISPSESFSVAQYQKQAIFEIKCSWSQNKLPIIVGGTGQYISSLVSPSNDTFHIKPSKVLRFFLNHLSVKWLKIIYKSLDSDTYQKLNNSDINNPHRLIRKIEISILKNFHQSKSPESLTADIFHVHLTASNDFIFKNIDKRVKDRLSSGLLAEIQKLLKKHSWNSPGLNALAYKEFKPYFEHKSSTLLEECISRWRFDEHALMRRQKVWFKKMNGLEVFHVSEPNFYSHLLEKVDKWYNKPWQPKE